MNGVQKKVSHWMAKWGISSIWQFIAINVTFALTGFSILFLKDLLYRLLGVSESGFFTKALVFILFLVPIYNLTLLCWGILLGQFRFFIEYEKRFLLRIRKLFSFRRKRNEKVEM